MQTHPITYLIPGLGTCGETRHYRCPLCVIAEERRNRRESFRVLIVAVVLRTVLNTWDVFSL